MRPPSALFLLPLLSLGGCAWLERLQGLSDALEQLTPTISYDRLDLNAVDFNGVEADFVFNIENPNPVALKLASLSYDLDLEGRDLLTGDQDDGLELGAQSTSQIEIPVSVAFSDVIGLVGELKGQDNVAFTISGGLGVNTAAGVIQVPFEKSGEFPMLRAPQFKFQKIRVAGLDLLQQEADLEVDLGVSHDQGSTMGFQSFDYELSFAGTAVADGAVAQLAQIPAGGEETVTLPISLKLVDLGSTIVNAITKKEALDAKLTASVDVDTPFGLVPFSFDTTDRIKLQ